MKQQMLQKEVDKLTKKTAKQAETITKQEYIITKLREVLLVNNPENQVVIDGIYKEAEKVSKMSDEEKRLFSSVK